LTQPLDAIYGYNNIRAQLIQAKLAYEQSQKQLKRADLDLVYNVTNVFYNLLSVQKRQELAKMNLERQTDAYEIAKNKICSRSNQRSRGLADGSRFGRGSEQLRSCYYGSELGCQPF
jgi:outer membrane protein TolC